MRGAERFHAVCQRLTRILRQRRADRPCDLDRSSSPGRSVIFVGRTVLLPTRGQVKNGERHRKPDREVDGVLCQHPPPPWEPSRVGIIPQGTGFRIEPASWQWPSARASPPRPERGLHRPSDPSVGPLPHPGRGPGRAPLLLGSDLLDRDREHGMGALDLRADRRRWRAAAARGAAPRLVRARAVPLGLHPDRPVPRGAAPGRALTLVSDMGRAAPSRGRHRIRPPRLLLGAARTVRDAPGTFNCRASQGIVPLPCSTCRSTASVTSSPRGDPPILARLGRRGQGVASALEPLARLLQEDRATSTSMKGSSASSLRNRVLQPRSSTALSWAGNGRGPFLALRHRGGLPRDGSASPRELRSRTRSPGLVGRREGPDRPGDFRRPRRIYEDYGDFITSIQGCYVTAEDVGTSVEDMGRGLLPYPVHDLHSPHWRPRQSFGAHARGLSVGWRRPSPISVWHPGGNDGRGPGLACGEPLFGFLRGREWPYPGLDKTLLAGSLA